MLQGTHISHSAEETMQLGEAFGRSLVAGDCVALVGELGTGKTTFVHGLAQGVGVQATVSSPTYLIVQEYPGPLPIFHMDAYRLQGAEELHDIGFEDYLNAGGVVVVEWGDKVASALPTQSQWVKFEMLPNQSHRITLPTQYEQQH